MGRGRLERPRGARRWGGQDLPHALNAACIEMWNSASMAFGLGPMLTMAGVDALFAHGSDDLKARYLPKLVSGEWMGTMHLTEPQAGSDVGALRSKAERATMAAIASTARRSSSPTASTISPTTSCTWCWPAARRAGRHARHLALPGAEIPAQRRRLARPAQRCARAFDRAQDGHSRPHPPAPWCWATQGGAVGYLVGEENRGMACMFTMMNLARLAVGLQGVAVAERATQQALAYARERKQGRAGPCRLERRSSHIPTSSACC